MRRGHLVRAALPAVTIALVLAGCDATSSAPSSAPTSTFGSSEAPAPRSTPTIAPLVVPTPVAGEVARVDYTQASGVVSSRSESPPQAAVDYAVTAACRATGTVELTFVVHQGDVVVASGNVPCGPDIVRDTVGNLQPGPAADITLTGDLAAVSAAFATVGPSM